MKRYGLVEPVWADVRKIDQKKPYSEPELFELGRAFRRGVREN